MSAAYSIEDLSRTLVVQIRRPVFGYTERGVSLKASVANNEYALVDYQDHMVETTGKGKHRLLRCSFSLQELTVNDDGLYECYS